MLRRLYRYIKEVDERFRRYHDPAFREAVARALMSKGVCGVRLSRFQEALVAWDDLIQRYGQDDDPAIARQVAMAQHNKQAVLGRIKLRWPIEHGL